MEKVTYLNIEIKDSKQRIDRFLLGKYKFLSHTLVAKLLRDGQIRVNSKRAKLNYYLEVGDNLRIPPLEKYQKFAETKPKVTIIITKEQIKTILASVIYKDDEVIVLNKPANLAVQGGTNVGFNLDVALEYLNFNNTEKPKLVHRLDKETTGVIILARNRFAADNLLKQFQNKVIRKEYICLSFNKPILKEGIINLPLNKQGLKVVVDKEHGKEAITKYNSLAGGDSATLLGVEPLTGRTHQIRVHLSAKLQCPIVGDYQYGFRKNSKLNFNQNKLYLHARAIEFLGINGNKIRVVAPLDPEFQQALNYLAIEFKL